MVTVVVITVVYFLLIQLFPKILLSELLLLCSVFSEFSDRQQNKGVSRIFQQMQTSIYHGMEAFLILWSVLFVTNYIKFSLLYVSYQFELSIQKFVLFASNMHCSCGSHCCLLQYHMLYVQDVVLTSGYFMVDFKDLISDSSMSACTTSLLYLANNQISRCRWHFYCLVKLMLLS